MTNETRRILPRAIAAFVISAAFGSASFAGDFTVREGQRYRATLALDFGHKQVRMNAQALYMDRSAIGYTAVPYVVGGTGWVFTADVGTWF